MVLESELQISIPLLVQKPDRYCVTANFCFQIEKTQESDTHDRFLWCHTKKNKNGCFSWHASPSWLYMKPAQNTTVGPVERVRGIKNKDINPVCLSLSLSREVRFRFARLPLRPLCLSWDTLCLFVEAAPNRTASAVCVCAAALIYRCLPIWEANSHIWASFTLDLKLLGNIFSPDCFFFLLLIWDLQTTYSSYTALL